MAFVCISSERRAKFHAGKALAMPSVTSLTGDSSEYFLISVCPCIAFSATLPGISLASMGRFQNVLPSTFDSENRITSSSNGLPVVRVPSARSIVMS